MIDPPLTLDEPLRLESLRASKQLDTPLDERFERITRLAQRLLQSRIAAISLVDANRQWFKSIQGLNATETSRAVSFCGHTILQDDVMVVPDARNDERFFDSPLVVGFPHVVFYAGCTLHLPDGSKMGSLCVMDPKSRTMSPEDVQILRDLAALAEAEFATVMGDGARRELMAEVGEMSRRARVDALTRLWNRSAIFSLLDAEIEQARKAGTSVGVIMADLDHFKLVNDNLGHLAGDEVLRRAAQRMLGAVRSTDHLGRYGGEEFMIVLVGAKSLADADTVAERVRQCMAAAPVAIEDGWAPVTVSLGLAMCEAGGAMSGQGLVDAADKALYRAKLGGRNRVESTWIER